MREMTPNRPKVLFTAVIFTLLAPDGLLGPGADHYPRTHDRPTTSRHGIAALDQPAANSTSTTNRRNLRRLQRPPLSGRPTRLLRRSRRRHLNRRLQQHRRRRRPRLRFQRQPPNPRLPPLPRPPRSPRRPVPQFQRQPIPPSLLLSLDIIQTQRQPLYPHNRHRRLPLNPHRRPWPTPGAESQLRLNTGARHTTRTITATSSQSNPE